MHLFGSIPYRYNARPSDSLPFTRTPAEKRIRKAKIRLARLGREIAPAAVGLLIVPFAAQCLASLVGGLVVAGYVGRETGFETELSGYPSHTGLTWLAANGFLSLTSLVAVLAVALVTVAGLYGLGLKILPTKKRKLKLS